MGMNLESRRTSDIMDKCCKYVRKPTFKPVYYGVNDDGRDRYMKKSEESPLRINPKLIVARCKCLCQSPIRF